MPIIDTHAHVSQSWYEPAETLLYQMDRNGVDMAVMIQYMGQYDNSYQAECARQHPDRLASLVLVDAAASDAGTVIAELADQGAVGVRLRPETRSPGDDPLALWRAAESLGLPVSCGGTADDFASDTFAAVVAAVPKLPIVLEHWASVNHPDGEQAPYPVRRAALDLARFDNVYLKIHGLGEFSPRAMPVRQPFPFETPIPPILDLAMEAFGPDRMMWGSDFPPVAGREGYANALRWPMEALIHRREEDRAAIFGGTAARVFGL